MNDKNIKHLKCKCGQVNFIPEQTQGLECYYCDNFDRKTPSNGVEEMTAQKIREVTRYLSKIVKIMFTDNNISPESGKPSPSWTTRLMGNYLIFIPRKSCYLPNDEIVDTIAHECAHVLSPWYGKEVKVHNPQWEEIYDENRKKLFVEFADFINSSNLNAKFTKGFKHFKVYQDYWEGTNKG